MKPTPFDIVKGRIFLTYGHTSERYCLPSGIEVAYEKLIHEHLKRIGYEVVIFFGKRGGFFLDTASHDYVINPTKAATPSAQPAAIRGENKLVKAPGGLSMRRPAWPATLPVTQAQSNDRLLYPNLANITASLTLIDKLVRDNSRPIAIVFCDTHIHSYKPDSELNTAFTNLLHHTITSLPTFNQNIIIFNIPGSNPAALLENARWSSLAPLDSAGQQKLLAVPICIGPPDGDEVKNYLLSRYLKNHIRIDWLNFSRCITTLSAYIKEKDLNLQVLYQKEKNVELNEKTVQELIGKNMEKPAREQLGELIGMNNVKEYISIKSAGFKKTDASKTQQASEDILRLVPPSPPAWVKKLHLHLALTGNPGTGKTTVARLLGELYREAGILSVGHVVEVSRADLVAPYVGQTALKTWNAIQRALGGVLFIDEAYDVCKGRDDQFGQEAVAALVKAMTDLQGQFMVVIAGYPADIERFIGENEGLERRFDERLHIDDYKPVELEQILRRYLKKITTLPLSQELDEGLMRLCKNIYGSREKGFGNAGDMEKLADKIVKKAISRNAENLRPSHLPPDYADLFAETEMNEGGIITKLDALVGLSRVKTKIERIFNNIAAEKMRTPDGRVMPGHFLFLGRPGTGKTEVARLMAEQFFALGIVQTKKLHARTASKLIRGYVGQTKEAAEKFFAEGLGKVIFIDEAHQLAGDAGGGANFGKDVMDVLIPFSEDHREECVIILAGYEDKMKDLAAMDPGFFGRFRNQIKFPDYSPEEMVKIFNLFAERKRIRWPFDECGEMMKRYFAELKERLAGDFHNGRTVRNEFLECMERQAQKLAELKTQEGFDPAWAFELTKDDLPEVSEPEKTEEGVITRLNSLIGLSGAKTAIQEIFHVIDAQKLRNDGGTVMPGHFLFLGRPGTGKTTVARLMAEQFYALGIVQTRELHATTAGQFVRGYVGQTKEAAQKFLAEGLGKVIFIDEAHQLAGDGRGNTDFGKEVIDVLIPFTENNRDKCVIILAGYADKMKGLQIIDPGFNERFLNHIDFEDYSPGEMVQIFNAFIAEKKMRWPYDDCREELAKYFAVMQTTLGDSFANARTVRNEVDKCIRRQAVRLAGLKVQAGFDPAWAWELTQDDLPEVS